MNEIPSSRESRDTPEYWDGHYFDDNCPWRERKPSPRKYKTSDAFRFSKEILADFTSVTGRALLRRFDHGETFDANNFPPGTVIKFNREHYFISNLGFGKPENIYAKTDYFGIVCMVETAEGEERKLVKISERDLKAKLPFSYHLMDSRINVGEVIHTRLVKGQGFPSIEGIERTSWVEVWQMGKGMPEKQKRQGLFRKLLPQIVR